MKITLFLLSLVLHISLTLAQVGINTKEIKGILHIDGKQDNPISGTINSIQEANDVVVTKDGNIGVGTINPTAKLHLKSNTKYGAFRFTDGTEHVGLILQGDADGNAFWGMAKGVGGHLLNAQQSALNIKKSQTVQLPINTTGNVIKILNDGNFAIILNWSPMLLKTGMANTDHTTQRSRQVNVKYQLIRKRAGVADATLQTVTARPFCNIFQYTQMYTTFMTTDLKRNDTVAINVMFVSNTDSDGDLLYLQLSPTSPYSALASAAYASAGVIFYQL